MTTETTLWLDILADVSTIIAALAVLATTFFVARQVGLQARDVDNDEKRYMRETLTVVHDTLQDPGFRDARQAFFNGPHEKDYTALSDLEKRYARRILSVYGLLWRMVKYRAVDENLLTDYWGSALTRDWERLENFVSGERLRQQNHNLYSQTEEMAAKWGKTTNA